MSSLGGNIEKLSEEYVPWSDWVAVDPWGE